MATETVIPRDTEDRRGAAGDAGGEITAIADMLMREVLRDDDPLQLQRVLLSNLARIRSLGNLVGMAVDPAVPIEEVRGDLYFSREEASHAFAHRPRAMKPSAFLELVSANNNDLYDVVALLSTIVDRLDELSGRPQAGLVQEEAHNTMRLARMALQKTKAVADELFHAIDAASRPGVAEPIAANVPMQ